MVNLSTSQFSYAYALDGSEIVGVVQNGNNTKVTLDTFNGLITDKSYVKIGHNANTESGYCISVGAYSRTFNRAIAVGYHAYGLADGATAVGKYSYAYAPHAIAIGTSAQAGGYRGLAIGKGANGRGLEAIAVGGGSYANGEAVAMGRYAQAHGQHDIAIGANASTNGNYHDQVAIGYDATCNAYSSIAIGTHATVLGSESGRYNIVIGHNAQAAEYYNIAIGTNVNSFGYPNFSESTIVGHFSSGLDTGSTVVGYSSAANTFGTAIGAYAYAGGIGSTAVGNHVIAVGINAIAIGGGAGAISNLSISVGGGYAGHDYSKVFGTDVASVAIGDFTVRGIAVNSISMRPTDRQQQFFGQTTTGNPTVILTADGNGPSSFNLPAIPPATMARMAVTVIGHGGTITDFDSLQTADYDSASFVMSPALVIRYSDTGTYDFIGEVPAFTLENSTAGAAGWAVPVLTIDTNTLNITVSNDAAVIDWVGFVKFEAGN